MVRRALLPVREGRAAPRARRVRREYELGLPDPMSHIADLGSRVGEATFAEQWQRGRTMTLIEAIDQASGIER